MTNKYIKVTLAGETKSHILMATLRDFYLAQGAKIEIPTEEEWKAVYPPTEDKEDQLQQLKEIHKAELQAALEDQKRLEKALADLKEHNNKLKKEYEELKKKEAELLAEREELLAKKKTTKQQ